MYVNNILRLGGWQCEKSAIITGAVSFKRIASSSLKHLIAVVLC